MQRTRKGPSELQSKEMETVHEKILVDVLTVVMGEPGLS